MSIKKMVRYTISGDDGGASYSVYNVSGAIRHAAWMLLRASEPHRSIRLETAVYCAICNGTGEILRLRQSAKECHGCKGHEPYTVTSVEELTAESLREGIF